MEKPLILVTNDDGIQSDGLWAAAEAVQPLGEVLVVAPDRQWSGAGRAIPFDVTGRVQFCPREIGSQQVSAYAVDASPALAVIHGVVRLAPRRPALVVSGVNFGTNLGTEVTISGTVGAAFEAAAFGIPALAVSLEMDPAYFFVGDQSADYTPAIAITQNLARHLLAHRLPYDVDVLNVNIPSCIGSDTPWRLTHLSRHRYFYPVPPDGSNGNWQPGYKILENAGHTEPDSDIRAVKVDRIVSVTPLSLDLTSRVGRQSLERHLRAGHGLDGQEPEVLSSSKSQVRRISNK